MPASAESTSPKLVPRIRLSGRSSGAKIPCESGNAPLARASVLAPIVAARAAVRATTSARAAPTAPGLGLLPVAHRDVEAVDSLEAAGGALDADQIDPGLGVAVGGPGVAV